MEKQLLSVMLRSKDSHNLIRSYIDPKMYSREAQIIFEFIKDYYDRDDSAGQVERTLLAEIMASTLTNQKHTEKFLEIVDEAYAFDTSDSNVRQVVLLARQREIGTELAMAIANGKEHDELVSQYQEILRYTSLDQLMDKGVENFTIEDLEHIIGTEADGSRKLRVYPLSLSGRLDGGLSGSDAMIMYARPNQGKTAAVLTIAGGFARQQADGIIFSNEERPNRLYIRQLSNLTGLSSYEVKADIRRARDLAEQMGFGHIRFISLSPGSPREIEAFVDKYNPRWFVVDQLRNLLVKGDSVANQLEASAKAVRTIGKKYDAIAVSVTQAGDSAEGKSILDMSDIDNSKTGIPGACDVMLGIGSNEQQKAQGIRVFSLPKNKLGEEANFPVRFNQTLSKYISAEEYQ